MSKTDKDAGLELEALLHPAEAFNHPKEVLQDPDLTLNEKRAILASWASDACAVEADPVLRVSPRGKAAVPFEDIIEALRDLDREARAAPMPARHYRKVIQKEGALRRIWRRKPSGGSEGSPLQ